MELAARYDAEGADELTFLDITASSDGRETMVSVVARTAEQVFIPFTVGGGVRSAEDARRILRAGADKVAVNTAALDRPALVTELADEFGAQCVVVAIDARAPAAAAGGRSTPTAGGAHRASTPSAGPRAAPPPVPARSCSPPWTATAPGDGFDLALTRAVADAVDVPVVASGGVGTLDHLVEGATVGGADAVLAASIFHRAELHHRRGQGPHGGPRRRGPPPRGPV